jgi:hypothetical protein
MVRPWLGQVPLARPWRRGSVLSGHNLGQVTYCAEWQGEGLVYKWFDNCKFTHTTTEAVIVPPPCVNGVPAGCPAETAPPAPTPSQAPPQAPAEPSGTTCCVEPGPGGNQIKKCYDGCDLVWTSPEGIYPGVPSCVGGKPSGCLPPPAQPTTEAAAEEPFVPAPTPPSVPEAPAEVTPSVPLQKYTTPSVPTGAFPGAPFAPLAPQAPVKSVPVAPAPSPMPAPCPPGPIPVRDWAYGCAFAEAGLIEAAPAAAPAEGGGIPTAVLIGGGGLVAAGIVAAVFGLFG